MLNLKSKNAYYCSPVSLSVPLWLVEDLHLA
jgi:hypothetical protein